MKTAAVAASRAAPTAMSVISHPAIPLVTTVWTTVGIWLGHGRPCSRRGRGPTVGVRREIHHQGKRRGSEESKAQQTTADCNNDARCAPDEVDVFHGDLLSYVGRLCLEV